MPPSALIQPVIAHFKAQRPKRTASVVVSFFGDAITLRGGTVWLGTLREFMAPLAVDDSALRVSMHRLSKDGWLESSKEGRNAYYSLTAKGDRVFREAGARIYGLPALAETDRIEMAILSDGDNRAALRQAHQDDGWGTLAPNIMVRPCLDTGTAPADQEAIHMVSRPDAGTLHRIVRIAWPLDDLARQIAEFEDLFRPIKAALGKGEKLNGDDAILLRVLLVHEYRRIVLKTPKIPLNFFPDNWRGETIRSLAAGIYSGVLPASEDWLDHHGVTPSGPLPPPDKALSERLQI